MAVDTQVAVIGGGVVGCAVAHALARRGVKALLLEAEPGLALGASGANSGILHTGFDSPPGELETKLILRSAELREELLGELSVRVWRCGARLAPGGEDEPAPGSWVAPRSGSARGSAGSRGRRGEASRSSSRTASGLPSPRRSTARGCMRMRSRDWRGGTLGG